LEDRLKERLNQLKQYGGPSSAASEAIEKELHEMFAESVKVAGTYYAETGEIYGAGYQPNKGVLVVKGGDVKYREILRNSRGRQVLKSVGDKWLPGLARTTH
jgi:hypothetical protein